MSDPAATARAHLSGILAMTAAMGCFIVSDIFCKLSAEGLAAGEVIAIRGLFATLIFAVPAAMSGALPLITTHMSKAWGTRIFGEIIAAVSFIPALAHMPIANLTAITQTIPLAMTAAGAIFLGEQVGIRRWTATLVGFCGVLLIMRPGTADFSWWSLAGLVCVGGVVLRDIATRRLEAGIPPVLLTATTAFGVTLAGLAMSLVDAPWTIPALQQIVYLALAAIAVAGGYYASLIAVQRAPLSTIAPFRYSIIPMSVTAGYLIWGERPAALTFVGIAIIIGAGLYTFLRERHLARKT